MMNVLRKGVGLTATMGLFLGVMTPAVDASAGPSVPPSVYGCPQPTVGAIWHHYLFMWTTWPFASSESTCAEQCKALLEGCTLVVTSSQKCASDEILSYAKISAMACKTNFANSVDQKNCAASFKSAQTDGLAWLLEEVAEAKEICQWGYESCLDSCEGPIL